MMRVIRGTAVLTAAMIAVVATSARAGDNVDAVRVDVIEDVGDRIVLRYEFGEFTREDVVIDGRSYAVIRLGGESLKKELGAPALPDVSRSVIIPGDAQMAVRVIDSRSYELEGIGVAPSKGFILRTTDPSKVPYTFSEVYERDSFWPADDATLREPYILRDHRGIVVTVNPFRYNPVRSTLRVCTEMTVELVAVGPGKVNVIEQPRRDRPLNGSFHDIYGSHFVNYDLDGRYDPLDEEGSMLVICHDAWMPNMQPFVDHKNAIGIPTTLVGVSTIGNNATAIKNHIQEVYDTTDLAFVLLVGDEAQVHTMYPSFGASDPSYSKLAGGDDYPDIMVGRFSAETAAHVDTQVQRTVEYEQNFATMQDWFWRGMGVASNQGPGDDGEYDDEHLDNIRDDLLAHGCTEVDQIYDPYANATMVADGLNAGRGIINYTGHGSSTSWGSSGFSNSHINQLVNDNMLPFIVSVACVNGDFDDTTCFGEAWLRATHNGEPTGAIGAYMSSINQSWDPPMEGQDEFNLLYCAESYNTYGALCFAGSCSMMDEYGSGGVSMFNTWHIFGDPSVRVVGTAGPGFGLAASPEAYDVCAPGVVEFDIEITQFLGYDEAVTLSATGVPDGVNVSFTANPVVPPATTTMIVDAGADAEPGVHAVQIVGTAIDMERTASVGLSLSTEMPAVASLASPPDGAIDVARKPLLTWDAVAQALEYELQIATTPAFTNVVYEAATIEPSHTVAVNLETITEHFWRVKANNGCGTSGWSEPFSFMTLEQPDYFTEEFASDDNDLDQWTVVFAPDGSGDYYDMCGYESTQLPTDPAGGIVLDLSDDDSETITPGQAVHVYGQSYSSLYVGSNGYVTFGGSDSDYTESLDDHFDMVRVAGLFDDLNPNSGGTISWKDLDDRVAVTWDGVPEYYSTGSNTFQIELFFDGTIRITWLSVDAADGIVGISGGDGMPTDYEETDISAAGPCQDPCPADIDGDGVVDVSDLLEVLADWDETSGPADINNDGLVDVSDLLIVLAAWGGC